MPADEEMVSRLGQRESVFRRKISSIICLCFMLKTNSQESINHTCTKARFSTCVVSPHRGYGHELSEIFTQIYVRTDSYCLFARPSSPPRLARCLRPRKGVRTGEYERNNTRQFVRFSCPKRINKTLSVTETARGAFSHVPCHVIKHINVK